MQCNSAIPPAGSPRQSESRGMLARGKAIRCGAATGERERLPADIEYS
jgi:hypothetical protein